MNSTDITGYHLKMLSKEMEQSLFKISHLQCEYVKGVPVLHLEALDIPRKKIIFIVGKSGVGKSTFIETLGLMNNTIAHQTRTSIQFFPNGKEPVELKNSWSLPNSLISRFRREHFSFIFQNTNLMPNFTSGENMMITLLIQGKTIQEAKREVLIVMKKLSLGEDVFDKKITEISGGQRQRLAFVRAITSEFTVLFGDEPTGNLDQGTAQELMNVLKEHTIEMGRTVIIVSHDLKLAEKFADIIIPITIISEQPPGTGSGEILLKNILYKKEPGWETDAGAKVLDLQTHLASFLTMKPIVS